MFSGHIFNSLKKYGWNMHSFLVVCTLPKDVTQEVLDEYELFYWKYYKDCGFEMLNIKEPGKGGKHVEETKHKISTTKKGSKQSKQTKQKIRDALKGRPALSNRKAVEQYSREGILLRDFNSQSEAARSVGSKASTAISECCQQKRKTHKGYIWKYKTNTL